MKVRFTQGAKKQLAAYQESQETVCGYLNGQRLGKFIIIDNLVVSAKISRDPGPGYLVFYQSYSQLPQGIFFINTQPILNDWLTEDLIMVVNKSKNEFFKYEFDNQKINHKLVKIY